MFSLPMRTRFRRVTRRDGVLLRGPAGWGEFSPFEEYGTDESSWWLAAALEAATTVWPSPVRPAVPVNCTVPAVEPGAARAVVEAGHGCRTAKVKVAEPGQTLDDDLARVLAVRDALGPDGRVRVDANGGWTVAQAVDAVRVLDEAGLEYVEQPCATVEELGEVRRRVTVPVAADESIRRADDPLRVARSGAADLAVLKVQPLGGVRRCLQLAEQLDDLGLPVVVSSALESSVGLAAGLALAAALPELPYACGLATASMFTADVTDTPLRPVDGQLPPIRLVPDPAALTASTADAPTTRRWHQRLQDCLAHLQREAQA